MYEIVSFLHKSLIAEEPSIKDKMKLPMEYFDPEALIKQQEVVPFKPPSPSLPKLPSNVPLNMIFLLSHLLVLLLFLGFFACKHVSSMRIFSF